MTSDPSSDGARRLDLATAAGLAAALRDLFEASHDVVQRSGPVSPAALRIAGHLCCDPADMASVAEAFPQWEHANLHRGVEAYLAQHSPSAEWFGISGMGNDHSDLAAIVTRPGYGHEICAASHATVATGPDKAMEAVACGLVTSAAPDGSPVLIGVRAGGHFGPPECRLEILAPQRPAAVAARTQIEQLMRANDVFRGQVLSFGVSEHRGNELLSFQPRPQLAADQVILPAGVLETIEQHVVGITAHAAKLTAAGQHLKRGMLLHGVPGTGKTHTVRYLIGRMTDCTVILMTGQAMRFIEPAAVLARRLQPSMVVLEDVDLVAMDRAFTPSSNPLLFALLDAMDGIGADADVTFVLTTNRAAMLERALADRPGRVDLAVEIPRPDAQARERLLRLYAGKLGVDADITPVIEATDGVSAAFIKELLRRASLAAFRRSADAITLTDADLAQAVEELSAQRQALTRSLLGEGSGGSEPSGDEPPPGVPGPFGPGVAVAAAPFIVRPPAYRRYP